MILIIDGHSVSYRIYYKTPPLSNSKGVPTSVLHSFLNLIISLREKLNPDTIYVVFDSKGETNRHKIHKEYKSQREKTPEDLIPQIERLKEILPLMGVCVAVKEATEADDIIYTLIKRNDDKNIYLITKDKDLHQLVNDRVKIYDYQDDIALDRDGVFKKIGVYPEQIKDFLALCGDKSDNIPGVRGVGEKTAAKLVSQFGSLEDLYENIDEVKGKLKEKLLAGKEDAFFSRSLIKLEEIDDIEIRDNKQDNEKLKKYLSDLELKTIYKRLFGEGFDDSVSGENYVDLAAWIDNELFLFKNGKLVNDFSILKEINYFYDLKGIIKNNKVDLKKFYDLKIISWMNNPDEGSVKKHKDESVETFLKRLSSLAEEEVSKLKNLQLEKLYRDIECNILLILAEMEKIGIKINADKVYNIHKELDEKLINIEKEIFDYCKEEFNLNSPKQLSVILFEKLGLKPVKKTKTGFSTSEEALKELIIQNPEHFILIEKILAYRELNKLKSTYTVNLLNYADESRRIHSEFNQTGTATGRISSTNPNLQNIPTSSDYGKRIRDCFEAESGFSFVSFDYSQIELRILAHLSKDEKLLEAFHKNEDIHTKTAKEIFNVDKVDARLRRIAKAVNFGIVYGLSPYGLARDTGISQKEASDFIDKYFKLYPKVKDYIESIIKQAGEKGYTETILRRKRFIRNINSKNKMLRQRAERIAINAPIQGSAADIIKLAMISVYKYLQDTKIDARMILQIHDELIFEVKDDVIDLFIKDTKELMESVIELDVPLSVNYGVGKTWGDLK
ncbi:DNA polymerase I [Deferribacter autotrophicus]|uniref:DNA polymerase I n=1 Tax=Deferribacter autotrophicus TaxID=500465 RepID=A0A5A8F6U5_9BACT|nr:DNA polymerase I [Deferribacter autotrophicus]KAA0257715.1 DNA polymerase I [Deferribacter autotrophicus]